jgi:hypothetical protein
MRTYSDAIRGDQMHAGTRRPMHARPSIQPNHIDGPVLTFRDGQMHWLTIWERLMFRFGLTDAERIERKRRPNLMRAIERARTKV